MTRGLSWFAALLAGSVAVAALLSVGPERAASAREGVSYTRVIDVVRLPEKWADAPKGRIEGRLTFSRPRPPQPIVVYGLREKGELSRPSSSDRLVVRQRGAQFDPSFAVIVTGDTVVFDNDEEKDIDHNVYGLGADPFDLGIFPRGDNAAHTFAVPGEVSIHCSVHKFMDARIFVAPSPVFVRLDGDASSFAMEEVPAGRYRLHTYQRAKRFRDAEAAIAVEPGRTTAVELEMTR